LTREFAYQFISRHQLAVLSSIAPGNKPQSALVGIAVSKDLKIIFDTVDRSRKYANLISNPLVSLVIGWEDETTLQYEGEAELLDELDGEKFREIYYACFPDGRQRAETWPGLVHFVVRPRWMRYSNFNLPQVIEEITF
jgi:hypothetical protein